MAIYLRHGTWWADLSLRGRRVRRSLHTDERPLALARARDLKAKLATETGPAGPALKDLGLRYCDWAWQAKPSSADRDEQRWKRLEAWFAGRGVTHLGHITPALVEEWKLDLKARGHVPKKKGGEPCADTSPGPLAKASVNRYLQLLRRAFNLAAEWDLWTGKSPVKSKAFYSEDREIRPLSREAVGKIIAAADQIQAKPLSPVQRIFADLVRFALNTGMRKSEILHLRWKDIQDGEAFIRGKGDKARRVPLNAAAAAIVEKQPRRTEFVFYVPNRDNHDAIRHTVKRVGKLAGVDWHFHLLRHYFTSAAIEAGADIVTVGKILGHGATMVTLLYSHTTRERARAVVDLLPPVPVTDAGKRKRKR